MELKGRTALIPGANRAIGRAIARYFASRGCRLILPLFDWPEDSAAMLAEFDGEGFDYIAPTTDLRDPESCRQLAVAVKEHFGSLDYLINNIERGGMPVVHGSYDHPHNKEQWQLEFDTTVKAKWLLFHHGAPLLSKKGWAAIVNISSIAGTLGRSGPTAAFYSDGYSAANRAVSSLTETWSRELAPEIRVNELVLGLVRSRHGEDTRGWQALSARERQEILMAPLLQRTATPEEVAETVYFLAVKAQYMTGSRLVMDGGLGLGGAKVPPMPPSILP